MFHLGLEALLKVLFQIMNSLIDFDMYDNVVIQKEKAKNQTYIYNKVTLSDKVKICEIRSKTQVSDLLISWRPSLGFAFLQTKVSNHSALISQAQIVVSEPKLPKSNSFSLKKIKHPKHAK